MNETKIYSSKFNTAATLIKQKNFQLFFFRRKFQAVLFINFPEKRETHTLLSSIAMKPENKNGEFLATN